MRPVCLEVCAGEGGSTRGLMDAGWDVIAVDNSRARPAAGLERKLNGCLEWTKATNAGGYGIINAGGKSTLTHRLAWTLANGPIPEGLDVCHRCDNPPCAQTEPTEGYPDGHLFLGTQAENNADRDAKRRGYQASRTHCKRGHPFDEANTRVWHGYRSCRECQKVRQQSTRAKESS